MTSRTRYVLLGVGGLALAVAVGLLVAFVLRSLPVAQPAAPAPAASTPPAPAGPIAPPPPAEAEPRPEAGQNECVDALGDAAVDLDSVQLEFHDDDLVAQFRFAAAPEGEVGFGLNLERRGDKAYLLGVALQDGDVDRVFVQDFDRSDTDDLDTDAVTADGSTFTVVFERDAIRRIGNDWQWSAFATAAGADPDLCPDSEQLEFER
ncbi:MAG: hypothetical protein JWR04_690 [Rhodoglobus sp.]|nr:hypothetical protein [Rhodoglobus sp.]